MKNIFPILLFLFAMQACDPSPDQQVTTNSIACMHYQLKKADGTRLDNTHCHFPCATEADATFCVTAGRGWLVPAWDTALLGMQAGETKTITILPEQGWGTHPPQGISRTDTLRLTIQVTSVSQPTE